MTRYLLPLVGLAGCAAEAAPTTPSWQLDVMPVLAANCVRCHGYPTNGFATPGFRLDSYDATKLASGDLIQGANVNATTIARRTKAAIRASGELAMPPGRELEDHEIQVLRNWAGLVDGSLRAPRGEGRPDNAVPTFSLVEVGRDATTIVFQYELRDADRDLVVGSLLGPVVNDQGQLGVAPIGDLVSGRDVIRWDISALAPGEYPLTARLDDGADLDGPDGSDDFVELSLGTIELVAP